MTATIIPLSFPVSASSAPTSAPAVQVTGGGEEALESLLATYDRALEEARRHLSAALAEVARHDAAFNQGALSREERDAYQSALNVEHMLEVVLRAESERVVLLEILCWAGRYAMDRVIAYHVRQRLTRDSLLEDSMAMRRDLLAMVRAVRPSLAPMPEAASLTVLDPGAAWSALRRHIRNGQGQ